MNKKIWGKVFVWLSILMIVFIVSGCSKRKQGASPAIRLEVFYTEQPHVSAFYNGIFKQFEETHPGVKIKANNIVGNYYMVLQTRFAGNTDPDIIHIQNKSLADYTDRGVLLNLKGYIDKDNYDMSDICKLGFEECGITENDIYAIPVTGTPEVLIYNKDLFDESGLAYPDENWTQKELLEAAQALTRDMDKDGRIDQIGISITSGWWASDFPVIWAGGGKIFNEDMTKCIVASAEAEEAIQFQIDLVNKYKVTSKGTPITSESKNYMELFIAGKLGMVPSLPYAALSQFSQVGRLNWDLALMPKGKKDRIVRYTGECWTISKNTKHPEEAWEVVKLLSSVKTAQGLARLNKIPARLSVLNSPDFVKPETPYHEEVIVESLKYARAIPSLRNIEKLNDIWGRQMELAELEKITVKEALENIEKQINDLLSKE